MESERIILGKIAGVYGLSGWVKVFSETKPKENIFSYSPWLINLNGQWQKIKVIKGRPQGKGLVAQLESCEDREQAQRFVGAVIAIEKAQLPETNEGEYYWADMIGLTVITQDGQQLGQVDHLFETGANDVVVVKGGKQEYLIPFVQGQYIVKVDLEAGVMRVDWDPEF